MTKDHLRVALYGRVSGDQQEKEDTIASQLEAVLQRIASDGLECDPDLHFVDDGYSGYILTRPGLERLRDQAAAGVIDRLYVLDPDRLSRKYAYQVLIPVISQPLQRPRGGLGRNRPATVERFQSKAGGA